MGDNDNEFGIEETPVTEFFSFESEEELEEVLEEIDELLEEEEEDVIEEIEELIEEYVIEYDPKGDPIIPHREHEWGDNVNVIQGEWAERLLNEAGSRHRHLYDRVAFVGHHRQNRFLAWLGAKMLRQRSESGPGGILFVPLELADYEPLQELDQLDDAPEGFVAFRAK